MIDIFKTKELDQKEKEIYNLKEENYSLKIEISTLKGFLETQKEQAERKNIDVKNLIWTTIPPNETFIGSLWFRKDYNNGEMSRICRVEKVNDWNRGNGEKEIIILKDISSDTCFYTDGEYFNTHTIYYAGPILEPKFEEK